MEISENLFERSSVVVEKDSYYWTRIPKIIQKLTLDFPKASVGKFYLIKPIAVGAEGKLWLAMNHSTSKTASLVVIKFFLTHGRGLEHRMWGRMRYSTSKLILAERECLLMPFGITVADNGLDFNRQTLNFISNKLDPEFATIFLDEAIERLIEKKVFHQDIEWRHVALICKKKSFLRGGGWVVRATMIDFGLSQDLTNLSQEEAMRQRRDSLKRAAKDSFQAQIEK